MRQKVLPILYFALFLCVCLLVLRTFWVLSHTLTPDFSVYYQAAKNLHEGKSLYSGHAIFTLFAYPPVTAMMFLPFLLFPYLQSQLLLLVLNFVALSGISVLAGLLLKKKFSLSLTLFVFSFSFLSFPTKFTLGMGQINLVAYFFLLLSFFLLGLNPSRYKFLLVALCFVMACIFKPILGFMVLFFIFQKQWKVIISAAGFAILFVVLSIVTHHHALFDYYYYFTHVIPEISKPVGREIYYNQGWMGFVFREISNQTLRLWGSYVGIIGLLGMLIVGLKKHTQPLYRFSLLLAVLPLLDTMSWQHHFVFLIMPFAFATIVFLKQRSWVRLCFVGVAYVLVSSNIARPEVFTHSPWNFLLSHTLYGALLLFAVLV